MMCACVRTQGVCECEGERGTEFVGGGAMGCGLWAVALWRR
jgi:hypothetical protein